MRLTWLDAVATALVAAIVALYVAFRATGDVPTPPSDPGPLSW